MNGTTCQSTACHSFNACRHYTLKLRQMFKRKRKHLTLISHSRIPFTEWRMFYFILFHVVGYSRLCKERNFRVSFLSRNAIQYQHAMESSEKMLSSAHQSSVYVYGENLSFSQSSILFHLFRVTQSVHNGTIVIRNTFSLEARSQILSY